MARFLSKPVEIEAYQVTKKMIEDHLFDGAPLPIGLELMRADWHRERRIVYDARFRVTTIHGEHAQVVLDDWVITEPDGVHFYPCQPDIFAAKYEVKP